jgi:hypothetical protein
MIEWVIQWSVMSLLLIALLHNLYLFFLDTLTVPKIRDLVYKPSERYNEVISSIQEEKKDEMQDELRTFLMNIKKEPETQPNYTPY